MSAATTCPYCVGHPCNCGRNAAALILHRFEEHFFRPRPGIDLGPIQQAGLPPDVFVLGGKLPPRPPVPALDAFLARIAALPLDPLRPRKGTP